MDKKNNDNILDSAEKKADTSINQENFNAQLSDNQKNDNSSIKKSSKKATEKPVKRTLIGGQAIMEGVMMRGKTTIAMAVRNPDGDILTDAKRLKSAKHGYSKIPVLRGLIAFFSSMIVGVNSLVKSTEISAPDEEVPSKGWMVFAVVAGLALGIGLFIILPSVINSFVIDALLKDKLDSSIFILVSSIVEGVLRIIIFISYLLLVSLLKDIRRTFMYHGAEHRTINCFEKGLDMTVENVQKCSTRHNRCGTTFLFFVMIIAILLFSLANWVFNKIGLGVENYNVAVAMLIKVGIRLALLPIVAGLSYELLRGLALMPDNKFTAILRAPGLALQRLTTYPPTDDMAEVALRSFLEVYEMDNNPNMSERSFGQLRISEIDTQIYKILDLVGADKAERDWILCDILKLNRSQLSRVSFLNLAQYKDLKRILERRKTGEPLDYILGYKDFYGEKIVVNNNALIPRLDTEIVVEKVLELIDDKELEILDLCTGSGAIAKVIASKSPKSKITATDISEKALSLTAVNLDGLINTKIKKSDMFKDLADEKFDIIVSNPPYIKTSVIDTLSEDVKGYEPLTALDGGDDGLKFYRIIALEAKNHLKEKGYLVLEIGYDQKKEVENLLKTQFKTVTTYQDLDKNDRVVVAEL